jgi:hypothetical protein
MGIKILLIGSLTCLFYFVIRGRSLLLQRVLGALLFVAVVLAVLFPDLTTVIAHLLGVGRGADLVLYTSFLLFSFLSYTAFLRIAQLQRQVTLLVRALAQVTAMKPEQAAGMLAAPSTASNAQPAAQSTTVK